MGWNELRQVPVPAARFEHTPDNANLARSSLPTPTLSAFTLTSTKSAEDPFPNGCAVDGLLLFGRDGIQQRRRTFYLHDFRNAAELKLMRLTRLLPGREDDAGGFQRLETRALNA
jgi:hypothetical protein